MVTAIVMVPEGSDEASPQGWVRQARRAATVDLLRQLGTVAGIERLLLVTPDARGLTLPGVAVVASDPGPLHAGATLAALVREYAIERLLYIGGGAAPLLPVASLAAVVRRLQEADRLVLCNNRFATDWAGVVPASALLSHVERLPRDNMLGWVLSTEGRLPSETLAPVTATRLDIDTPLDLQILRLHPRTQPALHAYLETLPLSLAPLQQVIEVLGAPASQVFIAGRIAPDAWQALNKATRCWLRVLAEERGMVSSGRQERGEVFSLLGAHLEAVGMDAFFRGLHHWAGAALIDTRVLMAQQRRWPSDHDRFASDLGRPEAVQDEWLQRLTLAARKAEVPVIFGGHGLMAGALYALAELVPSPG